MLGELDFDRRQGIHVGQHPRLGPVCDLVVAEEQDGVMYLIAILAASMVSSKASDGEAIASTGIGDSP